jgi:hypothetical protein
VVTAVADERGDYESMKQVVSIDASGTTLSYHSDKPKAGTGSGSDQETTVNRTVLPQDLSAAHDYAEIFGNTDPRSFPGTTAISASREVFSELQQKGATPFSFRPDGLKGALGNLVSTFSSIAGIDTKDVGGVSLDKLSKEQCTLQKEGNGLSAFPVLLNAQPTTLPAVRAGCMTDDGPAESTPVLEEIAGVLRDNPEWSLTVNGHTDNIGGDVYNLDLSKRRAAAVKQALITQYRIAPERLSADGFGASRPVDTNDTLAGRARNRRVELTRQ